MNFTDPYADHIIGRHRYEKNDECPACNPDHPDHQKVVMIEEDWDRAEREYLDQ